MRDPIPPTGLRAARLMKGWRVIDLAKAIHVAESTVWRIETGAIKQPRLGVRKALAKALGVAESKLF